MKTNTKKILIVTYQVGCFNNLLPVANELHKMGHELKVFAAGKSFDRWKKSSLGNLAKEANSKSGQYEFMSNLFRFNPDVVLTGTDAHSDLEYNVRRYAIKNNISSACFIDYWSVYFERFFRTDNRGSSIPDKVFVIDSIAKQDLIDIGIDQNKIKVTGSPSFENIEKLYANFKTKESSCIEIVFLSQPVSDLYQERFGLNELVILNFFINTLNKSQLAYNLKVKPHPRERTEKYKELVSRYDNDITLLEPQCDVYEMMIESDLVVGIVSSALIEASILRKRTLSVQYGSNNSFSFIGTTQKIVPTVFNEGELLQFFNSMAKKEKTLQDLSYLHKDALKNVIENLLF